MPAPPLITPDVAVRIEPYKGPDKDIRKTKQVVALEAQFKTMQTAIQGTPWFWGTILNNLSKDWSWR